MPTKHLALFAFVGGMAPQMVRRGRIGFMPSRGAGHGPAVKRLGLQGLQGPTNCFINTLNTPLGRAALQREQESRELCSGHRDHLVLRKHQNLTFSL